MTAFNDISSQPATGGSAVTPSDTVSLSGTSRAIYVGGAGNISALMSNGQTVTFTAVPIGTYLTICVQRINATGTTATNLVALF
jgi:hypothetical protein